MMLGGSPTSVATPPIFDASTSVTRNAMGLSSNRLLIAKETGAMSSTVVTLSSMAESPAVDSASNTNKRNGFASARCAAQMAKTSKRPVSRTMLMITIIHPYQQKYDVVVDTELMGIKRGVLR